MSTKKTLYWTLKRNWYAGGFQVMRVTTVKTRQIYGAIDDEPTHCRHDQVTGKFETEEAAKAVINRVAAVRKDHARLLNVMTAARNMAETAEREAIDAVVMGLDPPPAPTPLTVITKADVMGDGARVLAGKL